MRIAWFTPLSTRSAIGEFSVHVTQELARMAEVELWTSDEPPLLDTTLPVVRYRPGSSELAALPERDALIYNMGDYLPFHEDIHAVSREYPGIVILHDRVLHHLFAGKWLMGPDGVRELYVERMCAYYGEPGGDAARLSLEGERPPVWESDEEVLGYPLYEEAILNARGVIVHSARQAADVRSRWLGPVAALHLPCYAETLRAVSGAPPSERDGPLRLLTLGHLNPNKQVHRVVELLAADPALAARVTYTIAGPDEGFKAYVEDLRRFIARHADRLSVEIVGWQPQPELDRLMGEADIFVNLRHPPMEGSSASLMRQLAYGRPVLCFDSGFFGEIPPDAVVQVPAGDFPAAARALGELVEDRERRLRIGARARAIAANYNERVYAEGVLEMVARARRAAPALRLLDVVAGELGAMHVDPRLTIFEGIASDFGRVLALDDDADGPVLDDAGGAALDIDAGADGDSGAGEHLADDELRVALIGTDDGDRLATLFERNSVASVVDTFDPFPLSAAEARRIASTGGEDRYYIAVRGDETVGFSMLRGFDEGYEIPSFGVFVDHAHHGRGVGRQLTRWTVEQARLQGAPAVRLTVYASNLAARRLYESLGFVERERESVDRGGEPDEKIVMSLDFED